MKKITKIVMAFLISMICFSPMYASAKVEVTGFKETVDYEISVYDGQEGAESFVDSLKAFDINKHEASDKKVTVYIFRGSTCGYCLKAVEFFARMYEEYGELYDLQTYEVWNNSDNASLLESAAKKVGVSDIGGVPFIIIGDKYWEGFTESYGEEMINEIKSLYEVDVNKRFDAVAEGEVESDSSDITIIIAVAVIAAAIIGLLVYAKKSTK